MDLSQLRSLRKSSTNNLAKLTSELQKESGGYADDTRYWKLEGDKMGNGSAVIRFLPAIGENDLPWVKTYSHGFKGPTGKWYIENCLTTIGKDDPVVEHVNALYNSGIESDKKLASARKRRLAYVMNVLIVSDPKHPENEGQVKLFKVGKKIFDKIKDKLQPAFEDEKAVDVFNPWEGANFRLRMMKVDGFANYDKSTFDEPSEIGDDERILEVLNARHDLNELLDEKNFKPYDVLKRKLESVLNGTTMVQPTAAEKVLDDEPVAEQRPVARTAPAKQPAREVVTSDDDDDLSFFSSLVDD